VGLIIGILVTGILVWPQYPQSYPPANAHLALNGSLGANRAIWPEHLDPYGTCQFTHDAYQVTSNSENPSGEYCTNTKNTFRNFTMEVEMTLVKGEDAGIIFRNKTIGTAYAFLIEQNGKIHFNSYFHRIFQDHTGEVNNLTSSDLPLKEPLHLHQPNKIAVVAQGNTFRLYINQYLIINRDDPKNISDQGTIGFISQSPHHKSPSEALFRHATIWINK
jgi:hypothetical protein